MFESPNSALRTHATLDPAPQAVHSAAEEPRLAPIDRYAGFWLAVLRAAFRWMFGKVMAPLRVIFPRIPGYAFPHIVLMRFADRGLSLPRPLAHVLSMRVSRNNGCGFCYDLHKAAFVLDRPDPAALETATRALSDPTLDAQTRAVLAYADEVIANGNVSDATFSELTGLFTERQVVEIVWLAAFVIYTNMLARPLRLSAEGFCALAQAKFH